MSNPVRAIELTASRSEARTGDVIHFTAAASDEQGAPVATEEPGFGAGWEPPTESQGETQ